MGLHRNALGVCVYAFLVSVAWRSPARALTVEELDAREWHVKAVYIEGNQTFSDSTLRAEILTQVRPWYTPWRSRPVFDPVTFGQDLERLKRFYESRGFFDPRVVYHIEAEDVGGEDLLMITFWIEEKEPSTVSRVDVGVRAPEELPLRETLSIKPGQRFSEDDYQKGETELKEFFLEHGYAHVEVKRSARVDAAHHRVDVEYVVTPGPETVFGDTTIEGTKDVDPEIIREDLEWKTAERFELGKIKDSRENLLKTELFASSRIGWETTGQPWAVPMLVQVGEKPPREIKIGVGYATDEKYRAQLRWNHHNFFGGGRQMAVTLKYSAINASIGAQLTQPHFLSQHTNGVLEFRQDRDDEDNYVLYASRLHPRLEHRFSKSLSGSLGYRIEADKLDTVDDATVAALGSVKRELILSGPSLALVWNTTENPFDPHEGGVVSLTGDVAGLGGDFRFWKAGVEGKKYTALPWEIVLANRLQLTFADAMGAEENLPLFERLYAGGQKSVRGFGRRRLGPRSANNDPIGGLSAVEGAVEVRRAIWDALGGALFLDFGQVSTERLDPPIDDLELGYGFALSYMTPVGPLRVDVGFPVERPSGDAFFQVYFSIGQFF
ncbi:MAG: outer membrane protein assembly factor BamA [Candidatus Binatia bacterium]